MSDSPKVSIITPSYNDADYIINNIQSVKCQDYSDIEHIIIDGDSKDNTVDILRKHQEEYDLRWISEPDEGQSDAVNKGFKLANGELIGWLNSDDVYFDEEVISDMVDFFSKNNVDIAYGDRVIINKNNLLLRVHHIYPQFNYDMLKRVCYISQPSTFFSKNVIEEHKLDPDIDLPMDYDYWLRLADDDYNFRHIDRIVAGYRNHENAKTQSMKTKLGQQVKEVRSRHIDDLDDRKISKIKDNAVLAYNRLRGVQTMVEIYNKRRDLKFASEFKFDSLPKGIWRQLTYPQLSNNA